MELKKLVKEFYKIGDDIRTAFAKFKRAGKVQKTPAYKRRRTTEATSLWNDCKKKMDEIDAVLTQPDKCYDDEKQAITKVYKEYAEGLAELKGKIRDIDPTDEEVLSHLQRQEVRFDTLNRTVEDIHEKMEMNEAVSLAYCKTKLKAIQDYWSRIQIDDENIEFNRNLLPTDHAERLAGFERLVEQMKLFLQEQMETPVNKGSKDGVKVQRVTLPKFQGDYFKWVSFRDLFKSIVVDNKNLSNAERMQVLKTNISGEAESLIADLTISDVNFDCAWDRLTARYDNNRVVVYKHINKLMAQPMCKTEAQSIKSLLDTTDQVLLALKNLGRPTDTWDDWIVILITQKLSIECRKDWEKRIGNTTDLPVWQELKTFMEEEFRMLEGVENGQTGPKKNDVKQPEKPKGLKSYQTSINDLCPACSDNHKLFSCTKFKGMEVSQRCDMAKKQKLCFKCLKQHEGKLNCDKRKPCKKCDKNHSTWLHEIKFKEVASAHMKVETQELTATHGLVSSKQVLLATILVRTTDVYGRPVILRALVDSGSQGSLITERAAAILQQKSTLSNKFISGLGGKDSSKAKVMNLRISPRFESLTHINIECYLLKKLTKNLPDHDLCTKAWKHLQGLVLGDPTFHKTGPIDLLLGTDVVCEILQNELIRGDDGEPMAQKTSFGWIISGKIDANGAKNEVKCLVTSQQEEENDLSRFWEIEELNPRRTMTKEEKACEEFYSSTYSRDSEGRFTVKIPFKEGFQPHQLGTSKRPCQARFFQLEKKLAANDQLRKDYVTVMNEYIKLGHMIKVTELPLRERLYYIPHHAVIKLDSLTTKTRVVFDASSKTSTGKSLNDCMYTGAKQQHDLFDILIKWRKHRIVFKADIEKMYRQIGLDEEDQRYHTILWRDDPSTPVQEYQLTTATFGTAAAPFMAIRSLNQIGMDNKEEYPKASKVIREDFYVDDLISGCDDIIEAIQIKEELEKSLESGGLSLMKWSSNSQELLKTLSPDKTEKSLQMFSEEDTTKALGLLWNPRTDKFGFSVNWSSTKGRVTKRLLLSEASKLFDPMGWLAPVIIQAKLMMQNVWIAKVDWDDEVPPSVAENWIQFRSELGQLSKLSIDRWINYNPECEISIHGFCDASEKAYAAVVYTRIKVGDQVTVKLIASKTRVAPIKTKLSLPRLELCGANLLGNLMKTVREAKDLENAPTVAWCDSMITLGWIKRDPSSWKTFVANRVAEIQSQNIDHWNYIRSEENPADCASRGLMPGELKNHQLWWTGPVWLKNEPSEWPSSHIENHELEQRSMSVNLVAVTQDEVPQKFSNWTRLVRVVAYCRRKPDRKEH